MPVVERVLDGLSLAVLGGGHAILSFFSTPPQPPSEESTTRIVGRAQLAESFALDFRIVRPDDGGVRTIQVTATPEFDSQGAFRGSLGIFRDVSSERDMKQRLLLRAHTPASVDELVVICGPDDHILFVNRAFSRAYGYEERELIGQYIGIVRSPRNPPELTSAILPATLTRGWRGELWNRRKDGTDFLHDIEIRDTARCGFLQAPGYAKLASRLCRNHR